MLGSWIENNIKLIADSYAKQKLIADKQAHLKLFFRKIQKQDIGYIMPK